ncbi:hypothetical protein [Methanogenium sp. MK-MG]|uniref:hypothetical protein n=1 Tax=Methanogenium sp. MK-MG TaxID=2599926 RepID=UPI0013ED206F|nr:hypothetical protein [Methanogenium sp. MK-MG]KAF1078033.1 hypothetical protein MKMG_01075 [Methanogenium sp. MK-MG]
MRFDLIQCHALLHFCQWDRDEVGSITSFLTGKSTGNGWRRPMSGLMIRMTMREIIPVLMFSILQQVCSTELQMMRHQEKVCSDEHSSKFVQYRDICTDTKGTLHESGGTFTKADSYGGTDHSLYDPGMYANKDRAPERTPPLLSIDKKRDISGPVEIL